MTEGRRRVLLPGPAEGLGPGTVEHRHHALLEYITEMEQLGEGLPTAGNIIPVPGDIGVLPREDAVTEGSSFWKVQSRNLHAGVLAAEPFHLRCGTLIVVRQEEPVIASVHLGAGGDAGTVEINVGDAHPMGKGHHVLHVPVVLGHYHTIEHKGDILPCLNGIADIIFYRLKAGLGAYRLIDLSHAVHRELDIIHVGQNGSNGFPIVVEMRIGGDGNDDALFLLLDVTGHFCQMRIQNGLAQPREADRVEVRIQLIHNSQGFLQGHEAFVHLLSVYKFTRTHEAMKITDVAQLYHRVGGMSNDGGFIPAEPQPADAVTDVAEKVGIYPGIEDKLPQQFAPAFV